MLRQEKVQQAIKKEVSHIIANELKDPRLGFVTITAVEVTADLRYAKIYFSVLGKDKEYARTREALQSAEGFIRKHLAETIQLKFAPEIVFKEDHSSEYSIRIQAVIDEIHKMDGKRDARKEGEA